MQAGTITPGLITEADVYWARGIMHSRLMALVPENSLGLVPLADMLNHSPSTLSHVEWVRHAPFCPQQTHKSVASVAGPSESSGVVVIADKEYRSGDQIYINYGEKSPSEFLILYGFAPVPDVHELAHVVLGLKDEDPMKEKKRALLEGCGLPTEYIMPIRHDQLPQGFQAWSAFCASSSTLGAAWQDPEKLFKTLFPASPMFLKRQRVFRRRCCMTMDARLGSRRTLNLLRGRSSLGLALAHSKGFPIYPVQAFKIVQARNRLWMSNVLNACGGSDN